MKSIKILFLAALSAFVLLPAQAQEVKIELDELNSMKQQIKELQQQQKQLNDSIQRLNDNIDNLVRQQATLQQQKDQSDTLLAHAQAEVNELKAIRTEIADQLVQQISAWQQLPLSQLSMGEIQRAKEQTMKYSQDFPAVADAAKHLGPIYDDKRTLQDAMTCLNMPFDRAVVKMNRESLADVAKRRPGEMDLQDVITQLGDYPSAVQLFQGLIAEVEKAVGNQTKHAAALPDVNAMLADPEQTATIASIKTIPWLSQQLNQYLADLKKNCIKPGEVPAAIKALK